MEVPKIYKLGKKLVHVTGLQSFHNEFIRNEKVRNFYLSKCVNDACHTEQYPSAARDHPKEISSTDQPKTSSLEEQLCNVYQQTTNVQGDQFNNEFLVNPNDVDQSYHDMGDNIDDINYENNSINTQEQNCFQKEKDEVHFHWERPETLLLLSCYKDRLHRFKSGRCKLNVLYREIEREFRSKGYTKCNHDQIMIHIV